MTTPGSPQIDETTAEPAPAEHRRGEVLLVEDNLMVAELVHDMLEDLGYSVSMVSDAATALDATTKRNFDLIVSDIVMPGSINGLELAQRIRQKAPQQPILLVTGYSESVHSAMLEFKVLRKPYRQADLLEAITAILGEKPTSAG
jgi:CheY-like chemotaxis protein